MNKTLKRLLLQKSFITSVIILGMIASLAIYSLSYGNYNPYLTTSYHVAAPYAVPSWANIFPQYHDLPPNTDLFLSPLTPPNYNSTTYKITLVGAEVKYFNFTLNWPYSTPYSLDISFKALVNASPDQLFFINVFWTTPAGAKEFLLCNAPITQQAYIFLDYVNFIPIDQWVRLSFDTSNVFNLTSPFISKLPYTKLLAGVINLVMPEKGNYTLTIVLINNSSKPITFFFTLPHFSAKGKAYGLLGTDYNGAPVFPQFVLGARLSLEIALLASVLLVLIGAALGIISGYIGGKTDTVIIGITDFFLLLPGLPLLIVLEIILVRAGVNISKITLLIILIGLLSWPGTTRVIRSQTLSLRSRTFIEASRVLGLSNTQIMFKHVLPNLIPLIAAQIAYDIPAVVLVESGLDFLGLGITSYPTWGNMLGIAQGVISSANQFAWWWVLPPGIGIVLLSVSFFYLGEALIKTFTLTKAGE